MTESENLLTKWWWSMHTKLWLHFYCRKINLIWNLEGKYTCELPYKIIVQYCILQRMKNCFLPPQEYQLQEARRSGFSSVWKHLTGKNSPGKRQQKILSLRTWMKQFERRMKAIAIMKVLLVPCCWAENWGKKYTKLHRKLLQNYSLNTEEESISCLFRK